MYTIFSPLAAFITAPNASAAAASNDGMNGTVSGRGKCNIGPSCRAENR